jgi:signal peptidase I
LKRLWKEWGEPFVVAALIAIVIRTFFLGPYKIPTGSMRTTLLEGDRIFVDKVTYHFRPPKRGEIVVFKYPAEPKKDFVKRLIAFGGEEVEIRDGGVYINGKRVDDLPEIAGHYYYNRNDWSYGKEGQIIKVPQNAYFVLGDNSAQSSDSRNWGFVPKSHMIGRAFLIWWPLRRIGFTA